MNHKRTWIRLFSVLLLLILGFNLYYRLRLNRYDGITMTAMDGSSHPEGVSVVLANQTGNDLESGNVHDLRLQRRILGVWFPVWRDFTLGQTREAFGYAAGASHTIDLEWKYAYGTKSTGNYRVIKEFWVCHAPESRDQILLSAAFSID